MLCLWYNPFMSNSTTVRTRMAPSPTGQLHIGSMYVALRNYAYAKGRNGQFIIRVEDTDRERLVPGAMEKTLAAFKAYGLNYDEGPDVGGPYGPYIQSKRLPIYPQYAEELVQKGKAYHCFCSKERLDTMRQKQLETKQLPRYDRHCLKLTKEEVDAKLANHEPYVIRLKVPDHQQITFHDIIRGDISFNTDLIDDQVLLKSDGYPTYHLGVVVDDYLMKITHIIRGEEWISSTPKHVLLFQAFGWPMPVFAHVPDLLSPTGKGKMSKRQGDVSAQHFLDIGYLPEAMLNFLMVLGWASSDQEEILDMDRYIKEFDIKDINKKSVAFDTNKLDYFNGIYIRKLSNTELANRLRPFKPEELKEEIFIKFIPLIKDRLIKHSDFSDLSRYLYETPNIVKTELAKQAKMDADTLKTYFQKVIEKLESINDWSVTNLETALRSLQEELVLKPRPAFMSIRYALTGSEATPPLFDVIELLGRETTLNRLKSVI